MTLKESNIKNSYTTSKWFEQAFLVVIEREKLLQSYSLSSFFFFLPSPFLSPAIMTRKPFGLSFLLLLLFYLSRLAIPISGDVKWFNICGYMEIYRLLSKKRKGREEERKSHPCRKRRRLLK